LKYLSELVEYSSDVPVRMTTSDLRDDAIQAPAASRISVVGVFWS